MASSLLPFFMAFLFSSQPVLAQKSTIQVLPKFPIYWTNTNSSAVQTYKFPQGCLARVILLTKAAPDTYGDSLSFALAFYCNRRVTDTCLLAVLILDSANGFVRANRSPQVVWMANRRSPVKERAKLLTEQGRGLVLVDSDGDEVWSTNMPRDSVRSMLLMENGDLVLMNSSGSTIWHSFEHPADTLLIGQVLGERQSLVSSLTNTEPKGGKFSLSVTPSSLTAFVRYERPVSYLRLMPQGKLTNYAILSHVEFTERNITFFFYEGEHYVRYYSAFRQLSPVLLLRLDPDGVPRVYVWESEVGWNGLKFTLGGWDICQLPLACGNYGVCTKGGCSCPIATDGKDYFTPSCHYSPNLGCSYVYRPLNDNSTYRYQLVDFGNLSYFSYHDPTAAIAGLTELGACKQACEGDSSCKAAFFMYGSNASAGLCYLPWEVLTIRGEPIQGDMNNSAAFIKVPVLSTHRPRLPSLPPQGDQKDSSKFSLPSMNGKAAVIVACIAVCTVILCMILRKIKGGKYQGNNCFEQVPGAPVRFSYKELCLATGKFSTRLGKGGFGTVFKGELKDGILIAVKRLESVEQGNDFLAEMKTMGSIHHINLVKLYGFCADELKRLLVYEYMSNGSLNEWIFHEERKQALSWETRRRIILDVAKGLAYLHEECSQRIAHLDVKPHNILLDENFNAKISDFGLSRFIDRKQSHVVTGMKGTFGYLAPEWQHSRITVKADIYSFGIVILETVSGNLDYSQEDSEVHLLGVLQRKAREDRLIDIVDKKIMDWECHEEDMMKMIRIGVWCLNKDQSERPPMSTVVKVLEGTMELEHRIDFKFDHVLVLSCKSSTKSFSKSSSQSYS